MNTLDATIQIWREGNQYVAHAMPIDVASSGPTPAAARSAVAQAIQLFLATARDSGTLAEILEECGYELDGNTWRSPQMVATEHESLPLAV